MAKFYQRKKDREIEKAVDGKIGEDVERKNGRSMKKIQ